MNNARRLDRVERTASAILGGTELVVVDVGAAFGLPWHLSVLRNVASAVCYFEPDLEAAEALRLASRTRCLSNVKVFPVALANSDAERILYVTNVSTGSSLLKPGSDFGNAFCAPDYLHPIREVTIKTRQMRDVLVENGVRQADVIKIDVQGAELEVLAGLGSMLDTTLAVELEIGFPGAYIDQPGFAEVDAFMSKAGFLLYDLRLSSHHPHFNGDWQYYPREVFQVPPETSSLTKRITEADGVYFRRSDLILQKRDVPSIRRHLVLLCVYGFFIDALQLTTQAVEKGLLDGAQAKTLQNAIVAWHRASRDVLLDNKGLDRFIRFLKQWSMRLQGKLLGQRFYRWRD